MGKCNYNYHDRGQLKIYQRIVRSSLSLPEDQRLTLLFVLDRTLGWRKASAAISLEEFERGVRRKKAGRRYLVCAGTGLSPHQINVAVDGLREIGAIETDRYAPKTYYRINEHWSHPELPQSGLFAPWKLSESDYAYGNEHDDE